MKLAILLRLKSCGYLIFSHIISYYLILSHIISYYLILSTLSGWRFGTFLLFRNIGNIHPNWLSCFSEGWLNHQPVIHWPCPMSSPLSSFRWEVLWSNCRRCQRCLVTEVQDGGSKVRTVVSSLYGGVLIYGYIPWTYDIFWFLPCIYSIVYYQYMGRYYQEYMGMNMYD